MHIDQTKSSWVAHKFGGTSVINATCMRSVATVLQQRVNEQQIVILSAMKGTTDALIKAALQAACKDDGWSKTCLDIESRHIETAQELIGHAASTVIEQLEQEFVNLRDILHAQALLGAVSAEALSYIQGLGEVFSARIFTAFLQSQNQSAIFLDARQILVVRQEHFGACVEWEITQQNFDHWLAEHVTSRIVATGFIAKDVAGHATTLGRNGSDYSGAIFGALTNAQEIHIWTDVDGVLSADPRLVPEAVLIPELSYAEACELAYFGAKVIHPQTMAPAISKNIPIIIRNTFNTQHTGSAIRNNASLTTPVKGITAINQLALISIEGAGMIGVPGTAERVFSALQKANISVVMISQGSSEHSICCVVQSDASACAQQALEEVFVRELARGWIAAIRVKSGISILAAVGDGMAGTPGMAARLFDACARSRINICAIAQGSSERNISIAIEEIDVARALRAIHAAFYLSPQTISIGVIGLGQVGKTFLKQLSQAQTRLRDHANLDLRVRAIMNSRQLYRTEHNIDLTTWSEGITNHGEPADFEVFTQHIHTAYLPHAVIIDCSASGLVADYYATWLNQGIHVITPNKQAGSGDQSRYCNIHEAAQQGARFRYEATVGAGLPIMNTLRDLIDTGDEIHVVEGILSGTMAWLFYHFDGTIAFSELIKKARDLGYTEPDPRDDLCGRDVARKLVILGREMGMHLDLQDVQVESLVPHELVDVSLDVFLQNVSQVDADMLRRAQTAKNNNSVLRYVARLTQDGSACVQLMELPNTHAFAHGKETDNIVQFTTARYHNNPLVVQGPGAGPEVTAAGVFADLLRVAAGLGAKI